jgi:short-subunit dehydrogenase involved in D-alanine esterification of teichoic acids
MNTILIIGATSGLGEGFTRRFHALGKKVIITGRRQDRLGALQKELPGLETRQVRTNSQPNHPSPNQLADTFL